jgi:hypothetical protein
LNWSSADTSADAPLGEIGLYIKSPGWQRMVSAVVIPPFGLLRVL